MAHRSPLINVMVKAAGKAARALRRDFGEVENLQVSKKGPADFVSKADRKAEQALFDELNHARPTFGFLMEESGAKVGDAEHIRWIVDPLDGTTNFLHGLPHWAISIACEERGEIVAAVTYDPLKDELFWAERGRGAFLNDTRLRVSGRNDLGESVLATGIPFLGRGGHDNFHPILQTFMPEVAGIRRFGAATLDLAYVAAGRFDGFWETDLSPWDVAAGVLLIREAGGFITELDGGTNMIASGSVLAANEHLHRPMLRKIRGALINN